VVVHDFLSKDFNLTPHNHAEGNFENKKRLIFEGVSAILSYLYYQVTCLFHSPLSFNDILG